MTLARQPLAVNLGQGLDTKTDAAGVVAGRLLLLENGVFTRPKSIRKRPGYAQLGAGIGYPNTAFVSSAQALATYLNELLLADRSSLYSYDSANACWIAKGTFTSVNVSQTPIVRNTYQQTQQDSAIHSSGLAAYVWEDTQGGSRYSVIDRTTGQTVVASTAILSTAIKPKVFAIGNFLVILYANTSDFRIYAAPIAVSAPAAALVPVALSASAGNAQLNSTTPNYDATVFSSGSGLQLCVAYNNSTPATGGITAFYCLPENPTSVAASVSVIAEAATAITVFGDLFTHGPVVAWYNGTAVKLKAYDATLASALGSATVETVGSVVSISGVSTSSTALALRLFYSTSAASTYNYLTRTNTVTGAYVAGTVAVFLRSVAVAGKAFLYNGTAYIPLAYESPLQPSYFVADSAGNLVAKLLYAIGGGIPKRASLGSAMLTEVVALSGTNYQVALLAKDLLTTTSGQIYTQTGVESAVLNFFDTANSYLRAQLGQNLHLSGGFLSMYDGLAPVEHGFHLYPEPVSVAAVGSGGSLTAGTYGVIVVYEWIDNQGQTHRSAPSIAQSVVVVSNGSITVTIPTLRLTAKQARSPVLCVVYVTTSNGTTYFQDTAVGQKPNDTTADTISYTVTAADTTRQGNPTLYTTGGVIENVAPNAVSAMFVHRNRIWALDPTNPLQWWYSKQCLPPSVGVNTPPAEFTDSFIFNVDPKGGNCTAGASLDDKAILFKASSIFGLIGQGPDATGGQNDFSDAQLITTDCGCTNPRSIVLMPQGLMFQSQKGIYLLDRALAVSYIGADVEAYNGQTVTSAQLIPNTNQVRFTLSSGVALVYDYFVGQWSVFTNINAVDSTVWQGLFTYATPAGLTLQETPGVYSDAGNFIRLRLVTSWLQFAGVQGFQRVRRALILGNYVSSHKLMVSVAYDFNTAVLQTDTITPVAPASYGVDTPYGSGTPYGGTFPAYQYRVHLAQQKCTAIQLTIEDVSTGTPGEGFQLSSLLFEAGIKQGGYKLPAAQSVG